MKLLVLADPFDDEREMYAQYFRASGYNVEACRKAEDALAIAIARRPSAVVARIRQSGTIDGIELTRRLRAAVATRRVPVLLLTTHVERHVRPAALAAGCNSVKLLPYPLEKLLHELRRFGG
jgi:CheY-like chemotaxis protein